MAANEPDWGGALGVLSFAGAFALLGRAARWARKERLSIRRWSPRVLLWEGSLVLFSGFIGAGIAKALGWEDEAAWMVPSLLAYFGPEFIEDLVLRFRDRELPERRGVGGAGAPPGTGSGGTGESGETKHGDE